MDYKDSIEIIRKAYNELRFKSSIDALTATNAMEQAFPELKESDDERIRKELIEAFEAYDIESSWNLIPVKHILAWLEKQKENPKSADSIPPDCTSDAKCEDRHNEPGDFVFELRQIISRHWWSDEYSDRIKDEEGMAKEILDLCEKLKE